MSIKSTCTFITGVPYSGKSIPAGVLHHLGVYMGEFKFTPDPIYNRHDYYESAFMADMNGAITGTRSLPGAIETIYKIFNNEFQYDYDYIGKNSLKLVFSEYMRRGKYNWGIKDPRLCLPNLLPSLIDIVREFSDVQLIICERDFDEILQCNIDEMAGHNMPKKYTYDYLYGYVTGWKYLSDGIYNNFSGNKMKIDFREPIDNYKLFVKKMADFVQLPVNRNAEIFLEKRLENINNGN